MSTTTDVRVAAHYGVSGASLLFKLKVNNFMQFGGDAPHSTAAFTPSAHPHDPGALVQ
jgi:hypothetical protein